MKLDVSTIPYIELKSNMAEDDLDIFISIYCDQRENGEDLVMSTIEGYEKHSFSSTLAELTNSASWKDEDGNSCIHKEDMVYAVSVLEKIINLAHKALKEAQSLKQID